MNNLEAPMRLSTKDRDKVRVDTDLAAMKGVFSRELTPELAETYINSLKAHIGSAYETYGEFVEKGKEVHRALGRYIYGPVIVGFLQWVEGKLGEHGVKTGPVHFALRDAWPFYTAASVIWDGSNAHHAVGTYLNRPLMGIEDEIAPEHAGVNGYVAEYLAQSGVTDTGQAVALVDSGAWGTVVRSIKETYLPQTPFHPLFWYSHNPHISGFLNDVLPDAAIPLEFGEVLNDSLECVFPQQYRRPIAFETADDIHRLRLLKADPLSVAWGQAALEGVMEAAHTYKSGITKDVVRECLQQIYALSQESAATGQWTGVLPTHTPTWTKGEAFLAAWPDTLLP